MALSSIDCAVDSIFGHNGLIDRIQLEANPLREEEMNPFASLIHTFESHPWEFTENGDIIPFRLLDLPREIRDKVYNFALQSQASGNPYRHDINQLQQRVYRWGTPSVWCSYHLLSTNRQVHDEALPFLYTSKLFIFHEHELIVSWMTQRSERARRLIKHLGVEYWETFPRYPGGSYANRHLRTIAKWVQYSSKNLTLDYFVIEIRPESEDPSESSRFGDDEFHAQTWVKLMFGREYLGIPPFASLDEFEMYYLDQSPAMNECSISFIRARLCKESLKTTTSPFLNLPIKVRWQIYELLLHSSQEEYQICEYAPHCSTGNASSDIPQRAPFRITAEHPQDIHPAILATCHRIHEEATPILYTGNRLLEHVTEPISKAWVQAAYQRRMAKHAGRVARKRYLFK